MIKEKYYLCLNCGDIVTETKLLKVCSNGGMPYCYCEFENGKVLIGYKKIGKKEWEKLELKKLEIKIK